MKSKDYSWCKTAFSKNWATSEQLKIWVQAKKLTPEEFEEITGEAYTE